MAKKKEVKKNTKKKELKIDKPVEVEVVKEVKEDVKEDVKPIEVEVVKEVVKSTIFDKYREYIQQANDGYVRGLKYEQAMEMLRYVEKHTNRKMGLNMNCASCVVDLIKMFSRLENK